MNKAKLIDKIADDAGITKNCASRTLESMLEGIMVALKHNERVTLAGFGSWSIAERKARAGRNPQTGEAIEIKAKRAIRFRGAKQLDADLNR